MLGLRLGDKPQAVITTTPRPSKIIKALAAGKDTMVTRGSTFDNKAHLARVLRTHHRALPGPRHRPAGAVCRNCRGDAGGPVVARAARASTRCAGSGAQGIRRDCGRGRPTGTVWIKIRRMRAHRRGKSGKRALLCARDLTSQGETPGAWGARVGAAFRGFKANRVVAEINQGGDMVTEVLRQSEPNLPVRAVHATRGKFLRAEPIAALTSAAWSFTWGRSVSLRTSSAR